MFINSYSFGKISAGGEKYTSDIVIFPDKRVKSPWIRKKGHLLQLVDLEELLESLPDTIVIGTGYYGIMKIDGDVASLFRQKSIEYYTEKSQKAVDTFNKVSSSGKKTAGCFHLTC